MQEHTKFGRVLGRDSAQVALHCPPHFRDSQVIDFGYSLVREEAVERVPQRLMTDTDEFRAVLGSGFVEVIWSDVMEQL